MIIVAASSAAEAEEVTRLLADQLPPSRDWQVLAGAVGFEDPLAVFAYRLRGITVVVAPEAEALADSWERRAGGS